MVRGGEPVIEGTRIPAAEVAALVRDGVPPDRGSDFHPGISAARRKLSAGWDRVIQSPGVVGEVDEGGGGQNVEEPQWFDQAACPSPTVTASWKGTCGAL
ncbi:DUF433 domain-containing protein [Streptomyces sp. NBC_01794]|uniref:DUF433 domain-containing protein n=1 Tax=Streptomyces sp. NBC_01794 TaxID=2975942 RepID=UPI00308E611B|nr:DUF433 domain-containing protein [Streptomyces sp. NBC_01794]